MRDSCWSQAGRAAIGAVLLLVAAPAGADHHMGWYRSADLSLGYDGNSSNAAAGEDERANSFAAAGANLDYTWKPTLYTGLLFRGTLAGEGYEQDSRLSNGKVALLARVSHRPAGGFHMPLFAGWVSAAYREYGSDIRDGADYRAGGYVMAPLTTAIGARVSVGVSERMAASEVFDLSSRSAGLDLDWRLAPRATAYLGYQFIDGEQVSSNSSPPVGSGYDVTEDDDAFDDFRAYRVDARTQVATVGLNFALSGALSLDAQVQNADASADGGVGYDRWQGVVSLLMRL
ncbi:MAG: hypothetical protein ACRES8_04835 [Nevskiaceae bacterium]